MRESRSQGLTTEMSKQFGVVERMLPDVTQPDDGSGGDTPRRS